MVGVITLRSTDRVGGTARDAAGDLRAKAPALYFTDGGYGRLRAFYDIAADAVTAMGYKGAPEILYSADARTHDKTSKEELVRE